MAEVVHISGGGGSVTSYSPDVVKAVNQLKERNTEATLALLGDLEFIQRSIESGNKDILRSIDVSNKNLEEISLGMAGLSGSLSDLSNLARQSIRLQDLQLSELLKINDTLSNPDRTKAYALGRDAVRHAECGEYKEAISKLNIAIDGSPNFDGYSPDAELHALRGIIGFKNKGYESAKNDLLRAHKYETKREVIPLIAECEFHLGHVASAKDLYLQLGCGGIGRGSPTTGETVHFFKEMLEVVRKGDSVEAVFELIEEVLRSYSVYDDKDDKGVGTELVLWVLSNPDYVKEEELLHKTLIAVSEHEYKEERTKFESDAQHIYEISNQDIPIIRENNKVRYKNFVGKRYKDPPELFAHTERKEEKDFIFDLLCASIESIKEKDLADAPFQEVMCEQLFNALEDTIDQGKGVVIESFNKILKRFELKVRQGDHDAISVEDLTKLREKELLEQERKEFLEYKKGYEARIYESISMELKEYSTGARRMAGYNGEACYESHRDLFKKLSGNNDFFTFLDNICKNGFKRDSVIHPTKSDYLSMAEDYMRVFKEKLPLAIENIMDGMEELSEKRDFFNQCYIEYDLGSDDFSNEDRQLIEKFFPEEKQKITDMFSSKKEEIYGRFDLIRDLLGEYHLSLSYFSPKIRRPYSIINGKLYTRVCFEEEEVDGREHWDRVASYFPKDKDKIRDVIFSKYIEVRHGTLDEYYKKKRRWRREEIKENIIKSIFGSPRGPGPSRGHQ